MDFACYIKVTNNLTQPLSRKKWEQTCGRWSPPPPETIPARSSVEFKLKDKSGFYGSEGECAYAPVGAPLIDQMFTMKFACPFKQKNYVRTSVRNPSVATISYRARSGDGGWRDDSCPAKDYPLHVEFTFDYKTIRTSSHIGALNVRGERYAIQNSAGRLVDYGAPVWTWGGSYTDQEYSTRPAAFASGTTEVLTVLLRLDSAMAGVPFTLTGTLKDWVFESAVVLGTSGEQSVAVSCRSATTGARRVYGDIDWTIRVETSGQRIKLPETTRVELYWLPGRPSGIFPRGVWVTLLRALFPSVPAGADHAGLVSPLTKYCFVPEQEEYRKQYDSLSGAPHYGPRRKGGLFDIKKYFGGSKDPANCYDQAAVLQTSLGAFGIFEPSVTWAFQDPYGFIQTTSLLGRGECNNPFFEYTKSAMVVPVNDEKRTMFRNHAYLIMEPRSRVLDACQGPYTGSLGIEAYLAACIDRKTTLYAGERPPHNQPGTKNDIYSEKGVTSVETVSAAATPRSSNARLARQLLAAAPAAGPERFFEGPREGAFDGPLAGAGLRATYRREVLGRDGVLVLRSLEANGVPVELHAWVSSTGAEEAEARMLEAVDSLQRPLSADDVRAVPELGPRALAIGPGTRHLMWVRRNVFVWLSAGEDIDLLPAAAAIDAAVDRSPVTAEARRLPAAPAPAVSAETVRVGEGVELSFPEEPAWVDYELTGEGLLEVTALEGGAFRFRGVAPGRVEVTFLIGQPDTLAVVIRSVAVIIMP